MTATLQGYCHAWGSTWNSRGAVFGFAPDALRITSTCRLLYLHGRDPLARVEVGSLVIWQDAVGLGFEAALPLTSEAGALAHMIAGGARDMSIGTRGLAVTTRPDGTHLVTEALLKEISIADRRARSSGTACWLADEPYYSRLRDAWGTGERWPLRPSVVAARLAAEAPRAAQGRSPHHSMPLMVLPPMPPAVVRAQKMGLRW